MFTVFPRDMKCRAGELKIRQIGFEMRKRQLKIDKITLKMGASDLKIHEIV